MTFLGRIELPLLEPRALPTSPHLESGYPRWVSYKRLLALSIPLRLQILSSIEVQYSTSYTMPSAFTYHAKAQSTFKPPLIANENAYLGDVISRYSAMISSDNSY
jgi:hypothetical protein